ncbi:hypothetical protein [Marinobacter sp. F4218]|uniref:hypothetical protein n=1 Tax=Marinobacter sp. F4218 TaxID=2862868 RepID=UPI001C62858C|nr:hypothetical protein [Marinobacter sp. F4218]MBW7471105.1 hypothetical protein [Marinobacter sp. F4218]
MGHYGWRFLGVVLLLGAVAGCATHQYSEAPAVAVSGECRQQFLRWQDQVAVDGRFDAQDWSPPGFPYLRVDRFLASFELAELSPVQRRDWLRRAHGKALTAWRYEMQGGPVAASQWLAGLQECASLAIATLMSEPDLWPGLADVAEVPDSYSTTARVLGVYPLVAPVVRWRATVTMTDLAEQFAQYDAQAPWRTYLPVTFPEGDRSWPASYKRDSLGVPVLKDETLRGLFQRHAPGWRIETRDRNDVPGVPGRDESGDLHFRPEPVVYTHLNYVYQDGVILPQLVYVLWFAARPAEDGLDIYAGALDGFVWRVTVGEDGQPLVYDTIHPCGCYHQWLLVDGGLVLKEGVDFEAARLWLLGSVSSDDKAPLLSLSASEHQLVNVAAGGVATEGAVRSYRLEPLDGLRGRSLQGGRLYGGDGLIDGTERPERVLLWPTGVPSAGGMRQWGHHAVLFVGRRHFDDPYLLERYFRSLR